MITLAAMLSAALCALVIGAVLRRALGGWPTSREALGKWLVALLVAAVAFSMAPSLLRRLELIVGRWPTVPIDELVPALFALSIAALGYYAWRRDAGRFEQRREDDDATRLDERRRAEPPPARIDGQGRGTFRRVGGNGDGPT